MDDNGFSSQSSSKFKHAVRKIIPVRASVFERRYKETEKTLSEIASSIDSLLSNQNKLSVTLDDTAKTLAHYEKSQADVTRQLEVIRDQLSKIASNEETHAKSSDSVKRNLSNLSSSIADISKRMKQDRELAYRTEGFIRESVWAATFQQVVSTPSEWLRDTSFAPGRWAVGFPFLYVLYRTLNEMKPTSILELGLGQSTKMIGQYAAHYQNVSHRVVEHDAKWIEFWKRSNPNMPNTQIEMLDLTMVAHPEAAHEVRCYAGFEKILGDRKYDLISIDAPLGGDMTELARIDSLELVPNNLGDSFAIIIDDCNRKGEQRMVTLLEKRLNQFDISYSKGLYSGNKHCMIIASDNQAFLCSM